MTKFNIGDEVNVILGESDTLPANPRVRVRITGIRKEGFTNDIQIYDFVYLETMDDVSNGWSCSIGEFDWIAERWLEPIAPVDFAVGDIVEVVTNAYDDIGLIHQTGRVENVDDNITVSFPRQLSPFEGEIELYRDDIKLVFRPVGVKVDHTPRVLSAIKEVFNLDIDNSAKIANIKELLTELDTAS